MLFLKDFEFLRPYFLLLLIVLFVLFIVLKRRLSVFSSWENVCDRSLLKYLLSASTETSQKMRLFWLFWTLFFAVIALSGPSFYKTQQPAVMVENPLMVIFNLQSEMDRTDIRPSRLAHAKIKITDILEKTHAAPSGLIVYTDEPFVASPLSEDSQILTNLLPAVQTSIMPIGGNRLDRAIDLAVQRLVESRQTRGHILIFTSSKSAEDDAVLKSARQALDNGFHISVYDVSLTPDDFLQRVAKAGGGKYSGYFALGDQSISDFITSFKKGDFNLSQNKTITPEDNGWYFVFLSALGLLYFFRKGAVLLLLLSIFSNVSYAGFLYNTDQEAAHAYAFQKYDIAAEKFQNTDWKAAALYKAGNYEAALKYLEGKTDERSLYNKGNALAKSGDYQNAIKTYEEVLKMNPQNEDARFNLEYLKQMEQNNQQSASNNSSSQNDQKQEQNQNQNQNQDQQNQENQDQQNQDQNQENKEQNQNQEQEQTASESENNQNQDQNQEQAQNQEQEQEQEQDQNQNQNQEQDQERQEKSDHNQNSSKKQSEGQKPDSDDKAKPNASSQELKSGKKDDKYDETVQARAQRFREIKEDTGGLLKALIKEEYLKKRY